MMTTGVAARPEPNVRLEMKRHREELKLKRAVHPGVTQKEAGFTPAERERLACGVLAGLTERGERWANWAMVILAVVLVTAMGVGMVQGRWAERATVQTVEAGR
jgi:hypothetical protein